MKKCTVCKQEFGDQNTFCPSDGHSLESYTILEDKYQLEGKLGEGGMGQVYRAMHLQLNVPCAIKILHPNMVSNPTAIERFRREARATAQIRHANAVQVTDFGVTKDTNMVYLVMEFLEGHSLKEKINEKKLSYAEILSILAQTCAAVHAAHSKGIIHRDLKPDNILIVKSEDGIEHIKVLDFGIAKLKGRVDANTLTDTGMIVGTPSYMSPEQCRGQELDSRSDIYSLGIILYQLLTGKVPFSGPTPSAIIIMHAIETPKQLSELRPDIPKEVSDIVLRALQKEPENRQQTAVQLAREFENIVYKLGLVVPTPLTKRIIPDTVDVVEILKPTKQEKKNTEDPRLFNIDQKDIQQPSKIVVEQTLSDEKLLDDELLDQQLIISSSSSSIPISSNSSIKSLQKQQSPISIMVAGLLLVTGLGGWFFISRWKSWFEPIVVKQEIKVTPIKQEDSVIASPDGMLFIPSGTFIMGNNKSDENSEKPEHEVKVSAFYMDQYELTNAQYYEFIKATKYGAPDNWIDGSFPAGEDKYPVVNVNWFDAQAYATWAGKRLPTEAEWEYAARGTDKRIYPWGNEFSQRKANSKETAKNYTMPIGSYPLGASPFNIMDLAGNVAEWTASDNQLYPGSKATLENGFKVVRGGSFIFDKTNAMVTTRFIERPEVHKPFLGFRCAKDIPAK